MIVNECTDLVYSGKSSAINVLPVSFSSFRRNMHNNFITRLFNTREDKYKKKDIALTFRFHQNSTKTKALLFTLDLDRVIVDSGADAF